jgi:hypothetical protein
MLRHDLIRTAMVYGPSLLFVLVFPPVMGLAIAAGRRREARRLARIEAYRASPESHLLKLQ